MAVKPFIPCMDVQSNLSDPRDILAYVIRYYATAPKSVSDATPDLMISLADDISRYQNTPSTLVDSVTSILQVTLNRYFPPPGASSSVNVSTSDNGNGTYDLTIQIAASVAGTTYTMGADVSVSTTGLLELKFHPTLPSIA